MNRRAQEAVGTSATKKQVYIAGIVIALIVILVLVYFGGKQFAGKVIALPTTLGVGEAGILGTEISGGVLSVGIGANIGAAESVAFEFELTYPDTVTPLTSAFVPGRRWGTDAFSRITQVDGNIIKVEYATLDYMDALTGAVTLGEVEFSALSGNVLANVLATDFTVSNLRVWSIPDGPTEPITNLVLTIITPAGETVCGNNVIEGAEQCDDGNTISNDGCSSTCRIEVGTTSVTGSDVTTFCGSAANTVFCQNMCSTLNLCAVGLRAPLGVDLNTDGIVGNDELFIIKLALFAKESEPQSNCGGDGEPFCHFEAQGYYVCENLEFIQVRTAEAPAALQRCRGLEYIRGE